MKIRDKCNKKKINNQKRNKFTEIKKTVSLQKKEYYNMITIDFLQSFYLRKSNRDTKEIDVRHVKKSNDTHKKKYKIFDSFYDFSFFNNWYHCLFI